MLLPVSVAGMCEGMESNHLSVGMALDQGLSAVIEWDDQYRATLGNDGIAFDYILASGEWRDDLPIHWYVGAGAWSEWDHDEFGARVPLGLNWNLGHDWDAYGEIQPQLDLYSGPELKIGAAVGVKYTF
ncbi:hypothetical protein ACFFUP_02185 [Vibrio ostreicida]